MADSTPMLKLFLSDQMMITTIKLWCAADAGGPNGTVLYAYGLPLPLLE